MSWKPKKQSVLSKVEQGRKERRGISSSRGGRRRGWVSISGSLGFTSQPCPLHANVGSKSLNSENLLRTDFMYHLIDVCSILGVLDPVPCHHSNFFFSIILTLSQFYSFSLKPSFSGYSPGFLNWLLTNNVLSHVLSFGGRGSWGAWSRLCHCTPTSATQTTTALGLAHSTFSNTLPSEPYNSVILTPGSFCWNDLFNLCLSPQPEFSFIRAGAPS